MRHAALPTHRNGCVLYRLVDHREWRIDLLSSAGLAGPVTRAVPLSSALTLPRAVFICAQPVRGSNASVQPYSNSDNGNLSE